MAGYCYAVWLCIVVKGSAQVQELHRLQGKALTKAHNMLRRRVRRWILHRRLKQLASRKGQLKKHLTQLLTIDSGVQEV